MMSRQFEFDIYKVRYELIGVYRDHWQIWWVVDLKEPHIAHIILADRDYELHKIVWKYYARAHNRFHKLTADDLVWICRRELDIEKKISL